MANISLELNWKIILENGFPQVIFHHFSATKGKVHLKPLVPPLVKTFEIRPISSQICVWLLFLIIPVPV